MPSGSSGERKEAIKGYSSESPSGLTTIIEDEDELKKQIISHAKWDDENSNHIVNWMYYLRDVENGVDVLKSRLERNPKEFLSLRAIQDISDSLSHKDICEKHVKLAADNPKNGDYYYLATRCIEDERLKNEKFVAGHKKWRNHNWLAYAAGYVYAEQNKFELAYKSYEIAVEKNKTLAGLIADDAERIKRIIKLKSNKRYKTIVKNKDIDFYNNIESGDVEGKETNPDYVYYLIHKGKLKEAYKLSQKFASIKMYVSYLIAASKGATKEMKNSVFQNTNLEGLNLNSVWSAVGLAVKEGQDYKRFLPTFMTLELDTKAMEQLIGSIKAKQYQVIDNQVALLPIRWKAQVYTMANIILDGRIPTKWKQVYMGGLFANEKPFLH